MSKVRLSLLILAAVLALSGGAMTGVSDLCDLSDPRARAIGPRSGEWCFFEGAGGRWIRGLRAQMPMASAFKRSTGEWTLVDSAVTSIDARAPSLWIVPMRAAGQIALLALVRYPPRRSG